MRNLEIKNKNQDLTVKEEIESPRRNSNAKHRGINLDNPELVNGKALRVEVTWFSILKVLLVIAGIYLAYRLFTVFVMVFFAFIISSAALPLVRFFQSKGITKGLSIFLTYAIGVAFFIFVSTLILIPFTEELQSFDRDLPLLYENLVNNIANIANSFAFLDLDPVSVKETLNEEIKQNLKSFSFQDSLDQVAPALDRVSSAGSGIATLIFTVFLSAYIVIDHDTFLDLLLLRFSDRNRRNLVKNLIREVESKLGSWLVGQGTLSLIIGIMTWILLKIAGVPFALPLAVLAALLESVPNIGPIIASIPAILLTFLTKDLTYTGLVTLGYIVIQQLENNFIVPKVMGNAVGLKPLFVMLGVLAGFTLFGIIGAILAVPILVITRICYEFYRDLQKLKAKGMV